MGGTVRDFIGIGVAVIVLAGIAVALQPGSQTAAVVDTAAKGFAGIIRAATLRDA